MVVQTSGVEILEVQVIGPVISKLDEKREADLKLNREYEWLKCAKQGSVILTNFKNKIFLCRAEKVIPCMVTRGFSCAVSGVGHVFIAFLVALPLVTAVFGRRSEAKYFRPPHARKSLSYPG